MRHKFTGTTSYQFTIFYNSMRRSILPSFGKCPPGSAIHATGDDGQVPLLEAITLKDRWQREIDTRIPKRSGKVFISIFWWRFSYFATLFC